MSKSVRLTQAIRAVLVVQAIQQVAPDYEDHYNKMLDEMLALIKNKYEPSVEDQVVLQTWNVLETHQLEVKTEELATPRSPLALERRFLVGLLKKSDAADRGYVRYGRVLAKEYVESGLHSKDHVYKTAKTYSHVTISKLVGGTSLLRVWQTYEKGVIDTLEAYETLICGSSTLEQVEKVWPQARAVRANLPSAKLQLPSPVTSSVVAKIREDLANHNLL